MSAITKIDHEHPTVRETDEVYRSRFLVLELHPLFLSIRRKGCTDHLNVPYNALYDLAQKIAARGGK